MSAPFPYNAVAGVANDPAESEAENLLAQYSWLARWSDEMNKDVDLDYKKLAQFAFHCYKFRVWYDALQARITAGTHTPAQIGDCLEGVFRKRKMGWGNRAAMNSDLQDIYAAAGVVYDWIKTNMQEARNFTTAQFDANFINQTDVPVKVVKPAALATRIAQFRGLFS